MIIYIEIAGKMRWKPGKIISKKIKDELMKNKFQANFNSENDNLSRIHSLGCIH